MIRKCLSLVVCLVVSAVAFAQNKAGGSPRQHLCIDSGWRFALGHAYDPSKDFNNGTGSFSYFAKTGYGDGAASPEFDDRAWRKIDLPHDWAVEQPFDSKGTGSHGYRAIGRNFPDASVGWYRKTITIPQSDLGKHISIAFDGVYRNSVVWVNGHYLGTEPSGYTGFEYDISEYLNYGGENVIAVRADVTMEEGWFYEGAGIYRHVWLNKTNPLHVAPNGTFVTTMLKPASAEVTTTTTVINTDKQPRNFIVTETIINAEGKTVGSGAVYHLSLKPFASKDVQNTMTVNNPQLWSLESPYLHQLITRIEENGQIIDQYTTNFGIRSIRFDANEGFFLNGKRVEIKGTNNHQDHAGVGIALPDALQDFRIRTLKGMGCNAYRCSHNPPTPELLDACDRLGMLVIDENRLMGVAATELNYLKRMIIRDRNHPSIISWSIGNEEWGIEGNIQGARIAATMQTFAKSIDSTRYITAAVSGGIGNGISTVIDLLGYNYVATKNTDEQHQKYPAQFSWGTEEGSTVTSRGIYADDMAGQQLAAYDRKQNNFFLSLENGWKHYAARPYLAGMFIWTGFDYRGEPTPFGWPSVGSYFGMVDACGFPKDDYYYLKSWWTDQPVLHLLPHWNWKGKEGQEIAVWAHTNCDEVELFLNKKSLGKKAVEPNGHLEWKVNYQPGTLEAVGYKKGKKNSVDLVKTTGEANNIQLTTDQKTTAGNHKSLSIITVQVNDKNNLRVPTAANEITFKLTGPGKIIGVGNGDATSHEPDQYVETVNTLKFEGLKEKIVPGTANTDEVAANYDDNSWPTAFKDDRDDEFGKKVNYLIYRSTFMVPQNFNKAAVTFYYKCIGKQQTIYINGKPISTPVEANTKGYEFKLDSTILHPGRNTIAIVAKPLIKMNIWSSVNQDIGLIQLIYPAADWKRKLFSGYAQVIVEGTGEPGVITLQATSAELKAGEIQVTATKP